MARTEAHSAGGGTETVKPKNTVVVIEAPKFQRAIIGIVGVSPYVQHKFSEKARKQMRDKQALGSQGNKNRGKREPKDFDLAYQQAIHVSRDGWYGIPAPAFRNAMISACRLVGFKMTIAKMSVFIEADGFDADDATPLVRINGDPSPFETMVRLPTGVSDISVRPKWDEWSADVRVRWDASQFSATDVMNLMSRVGLQVGIGEGRPDSKNSAGMGWGLFEVKS